MTRPPGIRFPSIRLLGVRVDCLTLSDLMSTVAESARARSRITVLYVNVHCLNMAFRDAPYGHILESADLVYCDGTGIRLGAWLARRPIPTRMTGADWIHDLCRTAVRESLSLYFLGGAPGSADGAADDLRARYPGLSVLGAEPGYGVGQEAIDRINALRPDILLVGMGTPTQEKWIDAHRQQLDVPVVWAVGALFEFVSHRIPRGPHWMTSHGLEWLCRLAAEPRKLWRRYLVGNPVFLWRVVKEYWIRAYLPPGWRRLRGG